MTLVCLFSFLFNLASVKEAESLSDPLSKFRTSDIKAMLIEKYKSSDYAMLARKRLQEISKTVSINRQCSRITRPTQRKSESIEKVV